MKRINRVLLLLCLMAFVQSARAQFLIPEEEDCLRCSPQIVSVSMSGPTSALVGDYDYYYVNVSGGFVSSVSYSTTNATKISQTNSYVRVRWTAAGTGSVRASVYVNGTLYRVSKTVNVTSPAPATPPVPTVSTNTCGNKTLTRANPPSGVTYYWQTSSGGTSTSNSNSTYTVTSSRTVYLRARDNSSGSWSSSRSVSVTVNRIPGLPDPISVQKRCGNTKLEKDNAPSGVTWYWQTSAAGKSTSNSNTNYYVYSNKTIYLRGRNNASGCWGAARSVSVTVNQLPAAPTITSSQNTSDGGYTITRWNPPAGETWYWQDTNASGQSTANTSSTYTTTASGTYYLRARNNSTGCWSSATGQAVNVDLSKVPSNFSSVASENQITLSWNAVSGASSINVLRAETENGPFTLVKSVSGGTSSSVDVDLDYETTYFYQLQSITNGIYSLPSVISSSTTTIESGGNTDYTFTPQYNGNIAGITWNTGEKEKRYNYHYDPMNRIKAAQYAEKGEAGLFNQRKGGQQVFGIDYDKNGNIKALKRQNVLANTKLIDVLTYHYEQGASNRLQYVEDAAAYDGGFNDGHTGTDDYAYDDNGNMTRDRNKDIIQIDYNYLNLPERVEKADGQYIKYYYDAAGVKLAQEVYDASNTLIKRTDYIGEFIFEKEAAAAAELALIQHEEGRIVPDEHNEGFEYQYDLRDHLGQTRVTFTTKPKTWTFATDYEGTGNDDLDLFDDVTIRNNDIFDHTDADGTLYTKSQFLNGAENSRVGSVIPIPVGMGDEINITAWAKYTEISSIPSNAFTSIASSLLGAMNGGVTGNMEGAMSTINNNFGSGSLIGSAGFPVDNNAPRAYLNILFLPDGDDITLEKGSSFAYDQIATGASQLVGQPKNNNYDELRIDNFIAPSSGHVLIYFSNESPTLVDVYFDDITIEVTEHPVIQRDDYYPFGLSFNGYQRYEPQYAGSVMSSGIGWKDLGFRNYDPALSRFFAIDPLAELQLDLSPYQYAGNIPTSNIDELGLSIFRSIWKFLTGQQVDVEKTKRRGHRGKNVRKHKRNNGKGKKKKKKKDKDENKDSGTDSGSSSEDSGTTSHNDSQTGKRIFERSETQDDIDLDSGLDENQNDNEMDQNIGQSSVFGPLKPDDRIPNSLNPSSVSRKIFDPSSKRPAFSGTLVDKTYQRGLTNKDRNKYRQELYRSLPYVTALSIDKLTLFRSGSENDIFKNTEKLRYATITDLSTSENGGLLRRIGKPQAAQAIIDGIKQANSQSDETVDLSHVRDEYGSGLHEKTIKIGKKNVHVLVQISSNSDLIIDPNTKAPGTNPDGRRTYEFYGDSGQEDNFGIKIYVKQEDADDLENYLGIGGVRKILEDNDDLTITQINEVRQKLDNLSDDSEKKELYLLLQQKIPYENQRTIDIEAREGSIERNILGSQDLGDRLCQFTVIGQILSLHGEDNESGESLEEFRQQNYSVPNPLPEGVNDYDEHSNFRGMHSLWSNMLSDKGFNFSYLASYRVSKTQSELESLIKPTLEDGGGVMISIYSKLYNYPSHVVRVIGLNENGLIIDDPFGETDIVNYYNGNSSSRWSKKNDQTDENSENGEGIVWEWSDIESIKLFYIAKIEKNE